jgi:hypothetical protein
MTTYSFMDVVCSLDGPTGELDLGYGSANAEEGISINRAGDKNTMTVGADGEGMHSLHADKSGQIILRYLKTSPVNAKLMAMYDAQSLSASVWGKNVIITRHTSSGDIHTGRMCAFKKVPDMKYAKDGDILEWVFDVIKLDSVLGQY